jgi:putative addiction module component (TIGR02574 family)
MTLSKEELFNEAINLSPMDKAKLVELILSSFNFQSRREIDSAWGVEAEDRIQALKNGEMEKISMEDVFSSINYR